MPVKYTNEILEQAVRHSSSYAGVLRFLNIRQTGGGQSHIKRRVLRADIDTSHFTGQAWNKGRTFTKLRRTAASILVKREEGKRQHSHLLRRALAESFVPYACSRCGISEWLGGSITLDVDHINRDWLDDRLENIRFLCPNCHSLRPR